MLQHIGIVGVGGFLGANARYWLGSWLGAWLGGRWPWATLVINVSGSLVIGLLLVLLTERVEVDPRWRLLFVTGFLGAYTTFSTFSWEAIEMIERAEYLPAAGYLMASVVLGLVGVAVGAGLARRL